MVDLYVRLINKYGWTIDKVPEKLREAVQAALDAEGKN